MGGFPLLADALRKLKPSRFDDSVDRLHYFVTTFFLLFVAILITGYEYTGTPVLCWVRAEFKDTWKQFVDAFCFVQNTYAILYWKTEHTDVLYQMPDITKHSKAIGYYQWVPLVLACQALFFYLPNFIWKHFSWQSGLNMNGIMATTAKVVLSGDQRRQQLIGVADYIYDSLVLQRHKAAVKWWHWGNRWGSFVTCLYLLVKLLYLGNVITQLYLINSFLGFKNQWWGFHLLADLLSGRDWEQSEVFPRVTMCDYFEITTAGPQRHTSQCVLKINLFNEKIFLFLWFWFGLLAILSVINLLYWLVVTIFYCGRFNFVFDNLYAGGGVKRSERNGAKLHLFISRLLRSDGILLLRFINSHLGDLVATEVMCHLWNKFERDGGQLMLDGPIGNADAEALRNDKIYRVPIDHEKSAESEASGLKSHPNDLEMANWKVLP